MGKKKRGTKNKNTSENISRVKKALNTGFLFSIGIASVAKDNAEKLVGEIVRKGSLNEKQGRKLVSELVKRSKKEKERVRKIFMS